MKNSKIAIAALMALAMFSYSKAEEIKVDFDGKAFKNSSFEAGSQNVSFETLKENMEESYLPEVKLEKKPMATVVAGVNTDYSLINAINYCEKNKTGEIVTENLKKLLVYGTEEEKTEFLKYRKCDFPLKFLKTSFKTSFYEEFLSALTNKSVGNCVKWETKQVCVDKEVLLTQCIAGTVICYVAGGGGTCGPAGAVCTLITRIIPECVNIPYCVEWDPDAIPGNPGIL